MDAAADIGLVTLISMVLYLFLDTPLQNLLDYALKGKKKPARKNEMKSSSAVTLESTEIIELSNGENIQEEHKM